MDESSHEKAIVMALSYFIGFVTAYLVFGGAKYTEVVIVPSNSFTSSETREIPADESDNTETTLIMNDLGLFVSVFGNERILSANKASVIVSQSDEVRQNGFHYEIVAAEISPNEKFVYFCEQLAEVPTECEPVVFDIENDIAHKLSIEGATSVSIEAHTAQWLPDGSLNVNSFTSSSVDEPWR